MLTSTSVPLLGQIADLAAEPTAGDVMKAYAAACDLLWTLRPFERCWRLPPPDPFRGPGWNSFLVTDIAKLCLDYTELEGGFHPHFEAIGAVSWALARARQCRAVQFGAQIYASAAAGVVARVNSLVGAQMDAGFDELVAAIRGLGLGRHEVIWVVEAPGRLGEPPAVGRPGGQEPAAPTPCPRHGAGAGCDAGCEYVRRATAARDRSRASPPFREALSAISFGHVLIALKRRGFDLHAAQEELRLECAAAGACLARQGAAPEGLDAELEAEFGLAAGDAGRRRPGLVGGALAPPNAGRGDTAAPDRPQEGRVGATGRPADDPPRRPCGRPPRRGPLGLLLDEDSRTATREGRRAEFGGRAKAWQVFVELYSHGGGYCRPTDLDRLWADEAPDPGTVQQHVSAVRRLLAPLGVCVKHYHRLGYKLEEAAAQQQADAGRLKRA